MNLDEPFPLEAVPSRVRFALLLEFKGRCPSVQEVEQIPDKHWLAAPGLGPASLALVRSITHAGRQQAGSCDTSSSLSDAELLRRLEGLQEDLRWLEAQMKARLLKDPRHRPRRQGHNRTMGNEHHNAGHHDGGAESSQHQSDQDHVA